MSEPWKERELKELAELIDACKRRLHRLHLRAAMEGRDARAEDLIEIEDIKGKLKGLEAKYEELRKLEVALSVQEKAQFAQAREVLEQRLAQPLEIQAAFVNREEELRSILSPFGKPFIVVDAPAGYGKSYLLAEVERRLQSGELGKWLVARIQCGDGDDKSGIPIMNRIASEIGYKNGKSITLLDEFALAIIQVLRHEEADGFFLLFDDLERWKMPVDGAQWKGISGTVKHSLILTLYETMTREGWQFRAIFAGRYIADWGKDFFLPLQILPLSPFDKEVTRRFIQETLVAYQTLRGIRLDYSLEEFDRWADEVLEITGGHPGAIVKVLEHIGNQPRGFNIPLSDQKSPAYFFRADNKERLFRQFISGEIPTLLGGVAPQLREVLQIISVFRGFNASTLEALVDKGYIKGFTDSWMLYRQILGTHLIKPGPLLSQDKVLHRVLDAQMKFEMPSLYRELNNFAAELYSQWIQGRDHRNQPLPSGSPAGSDQISLMVEGLYHFYRANEGETSITEKITGKLEAYLTQLRFPFGRRQGMVALRQAIEKDEQLPELLRKALGQDGYLSFLDRIEQFAGGG